MDQTLHFTTDFNTFLFWDLLSTVAALIYVGFTAYRKGYDKGFEEKTRIEDLRQRAIAEEKAATPIKRKAVARKTTAKTAAEKTTPTPKPVVNTPASDSNGKQDAGTYAAAH